MTKNPHWIYLEQLRRSGVTNMCGAAPYLAMAFKLDIKMAQNILAEWMKNYNPADYQEE